MKRLRYSVVPLLSEPPAAVSPVRRDASVVAPKLRTEPEARTDGSVAD